MEKRIMMPGFLERFDAPPTRMKKRVVTKYKPIFYFEVPNGGVLRRVREGDTPSTAADDTLKAFISLHRIQENIIKQLPSSPQSVWIRLESSARVSGQSGPVEILLGPNSRYQLVQTCDLPLGGRPPFLWDNEGLEDIRQIEEDNMGVSLISDGLIQKQEGPSAATRVLRSSRGAEAVFTSRAEINVSMARETFKLVG